MIGFKLFLENKNLEVIKELYYKGMLGMQELYEVPEFANYIDSLSDSELEKDVETLWDKFVSLVKKGKIKIKSKIEDFIKKYKVTTEDLVTFGNVAYPKFNQVVILAGGGGSGKGFVQSNLLGIEGKVFDVDAIKVLSLGLDEIKNEVADKYGINKNLPLDKFRKEALKNPDVVSYLHFRLGDGNKDMGIKGMNMEQSIKYTLYKTILSANADRKPNLIFDSTTKRLEKVYEIAEYCIALGYNPEDIHLVWILNDVNTAMKQNLSRSRQVPTDTLFETHVGAAGTMIDIIKNSEKVEGIIDGDIWIVFNKAKIDVELESEKLAELDALYERFRKMINEKQNIKSNMNFSGKLKINPTGNISMAVQFDNICYIKDYNDNYISSQVYKEQTCKSGFNGKYIKPTETDTHKGIVYLDPTNLANECNENNYDSTPETKTGCMKFYIFDENEDGTVDMILDHNTSLGISWTLYKDNGNLTAYYGPREGLYQLYEDTNNWDAIADLTESSNYVPSSMHLNHAPYEIQYTSHLTNTFEQVAGAHKARFISAEEIAWLFDNLYNCLVNGCNEESNISTGNYEYWTGSSSAYNSKYAWVVDNYGDFKTDMVRSTSGGIRPVITVSKSVLGIN